MDREVEQDATVGAQGVCAVVDGEREEVDRAVQRQRAVLEPHQLVLGASHALPVVTPADVLAKRKYRSQQAVAGHSVRIKQKGNNSNSGI